MTCHEKDGKNNFKILLTVLLSMAVLVSGVGYQYYYHRQKIRYNEIISGYYREYFEREPDAPGLRHWVMWAQNKWGIKKVRQKGFIEAKSQGYK